MKNIYLLIIISVLLFSCKKDEKIIIDDVTSVEVFQDAIIDVTVATSIATGDVSYIAYELVRNYPNDLSFVVTSRGCENTVTTTVGSEITVISDYGEDGCTINGTHYTGKFTCVFPDGLNGDVELYFSDNYTIDGVGVDGVLELTRDGDLNGCQKYLVDSLNINTTDGAYQMNFFQDAVNNGGCAESVFLFCNQANLFSGDDVIQTSLCPVVTDLIEGDVCFTNSTEDLVIDFSCNHSKPVDGTVDIIQSTIHGIVVTGVIDFGYGTACDEEASFLDAIKNETVIIQL